MEPNVAIATIETDLRFLAAEVHGKSEEKAWLTEVLGKEAVTRLEDVRVEERKRRYPARVPETLLDYTSLSQIRRCIAKVDWQQFHQALGDKRDFEVLLDQVERYRNASAHSRELVQYERAFLEGLAGIIRTRVTMHRSTVDETSKYYPMIEHAADSFGNVAAHLDPNGTLVSLNTSLVLQVGDTVTFSVRGWDAQGRELTWVLRRGLAGRQIDKQTGNEATLTWLVDDDDVAIDVSVIINLKSNGRFHRYGHIDQDTTFRYRVDPPASQA